MMKVNNTTAVAYINKKWGAISASCSIWISSSHVPGVKNTTADLRQIFFMITKSDLSMERVVKSLFGQFGKLEIDLCLPVA